MKVLITGGGGFIGRKIARALADRGDQAIAFDFAFPAEAKRLAVENRRVHLVEGDITDLAPVIAAFQEHRPDAIIHCAAIVGVLFSIASPGNVFRVNLQGSINIFEAMRLCGVRRVVHMSSEEVYGDFEHPKINEDHPTRPNMPYGISKLAVEQTGRVYRDLHDLECINMRTSWVYGVGLPRPRPPTTFLDAALQGRACHLSFGADAAIDFTYMDDVVAGVLAALDEKSHKYDVYNLASGAATTLGEMVELIREMIPGADISAKPGPYMFTSTLRAPVKGALDMSRAHEALGFAPRFDLRRGFEAYIEDWRARAPG
ncbi:NAD-dependent epimerase/dehydratase family protein [Pikeienuella sp. HZG-20]|uniref:NAD-dependent epimerase/dehydratase family protein n=1 Tax=Paludibacillus litoralis TaxID=3133267 RepID=UPI0030EBC1CA